MEKREATIRLWFDMWLQKADLGIMDIFSDDVVYTESWGPEYHGVEKVKLWFNECTTRQDVLEWDIQQFFHKDDQTIVQWYFKYRYLNEAPKTFDGISLIKWTSDERIGQVQEFGCNKHHYDPYKNGGTPVFEDIQPMWF